MTDEYRVDWRNEAGGVSVEYFHGDRAAAVVFARAKAKEIGRSAYAIRSQYDTDLGQRVFHPDKTSHEDGEWFLD